MAIEKNSNMLFKFKNNCNCNKKKMFLNKEECKILLNIMFPGQIIADPKIEKLKNTFNRKICDLKQKYEGYIHKG